MSLLFGNISEDDILLQEQLEAMVNNHPDRWAGGCTPRGERNLMVLRVRYMKGAVQGGVGRSC